MNVLTISTRQLKVGMQIAEPKDFGRGWKLTPVTKVAVPGFVKDEKVTTCSSRGVHVNDSLCYPYHGEVYIKDTSSVES